MYAVALSPTCGLSARIGTSRAASSSPASRAATTLLGTYTDRKSTRLNSSHLVISYAVFCFKKKKNDIVLIIKLLRQFVTLVHTSIDTVTTDCTSLSLHDALPIFTGASHT